MSYQDEHQRLYDAVVASPRDDAPRLAFARHAAAMQPERARFIELQIARIEADRAAGRWRSHPSDEELRLSRGHAADWAQMIAPLTRPDERTRTGYGFNRGFVEIVRTTAEIVVEMSAQLFRLAPILQLAVLRPEPGGPSIHDLLAVPQLRQLDVLTLSGWGLGDDGVAAIAASEAVAGLTALNLRSNRIGRAGMDALAASPHTRAIFSIDLGQNAVTPPKRAEYDEHGKLQWQVTGLGQELEARYGTIPWVHAELTRDADPEHLRYVADAYRAAPR